MNPIVARSYRYAEAIARRQAGNFYHAFCILPGPQRRAMCALYAFLRHTDDLGDRDGVIANRAEALDAWRQGLEEALNGQCSHPLHMALGDCVRRFSIPASYLYATLEGVRSDLDIVRFAGFSDLYSYCYRVASAVGLACIHIWGFSGAEALGYAEKAGIAFQLTNILRDLREDAARNRVYLPQEDLQQFGYSENDLRAGRTGDRFQALMDFQASRALRFYDESAALSRHLNPPGRAVFQIMSRTYQSLLQAIRASGYDVFARRIDIPTWRKLSHVVQALPTRWGWR